MASPTEILDGCTHTIPGGMPGGPCMACALRAVEAAIEAEREACAMVAASVAAEYRDHTPLEARDIPACISAGKVADRIRARRSP